MAEIVGIIGGVQGILTLGAAAKQGSAKFWKAPKDVAVLKVGLENTFRAFKLISKTTI